MPKTIFSKARQNKPYIWTFIILGLKTVLTLSPPPTPLQSSSFFLTMEEIKRGLSSS